MKVLDKDLRDIDIYDVEEMEVFETALSKLTTLEEEIKNCKTIAESMRKECYAVFDFVNEVFGEGTDEFLFGNKTNILKCTQALTEIIANVNSKAKKDSSKVTSYIERSKK